MIQRRREADEPGQVAILGSEPVERPGPEAGPIEHAIARVQPQTRWPVRDFVSTAHGADNAHVVDHRSQLRKQVAYRYAALAIRLELPGRGQQIAGWRELEFRLGKRQRLTVAFGQFWFRIERIDMRYAAVQEKENDALRPGGKVRRLRRQRRDRLGGGFVGQQCGHGYRSKSASQSLQRRST